MRTAVTSFWRRNRRIEEWEVFAGFVIAAVALSGRTAFTCFYGRGVRYWWAVSAATRWLGLGSSLDRRPGDMTSSTVVRQRSPMHRFGRDVSVLAAGSADVQAGLALVSPLVTRFYSPGRTGLFVGFRSLGTIVAVGERLRYELRKRDAYADA